MLEAHRLKATKETIVCARRTILEHRSKLAGLSHGFAQARGRPHQDGLAGFGPYRQVAAAVGRIVKTLLAELGHKAPSFLVPGQIRRAIAGKNLIKQSQM